MPSLLRLPAAALLLALAACAGPEPQVESAWTSYLPRRASTSRNFVQGVVGITQYTSGPSVAAPGTVVLDDGSDTLPMLGGAFQHALKDGPLQLGIEGGLSGSWLTTRTVLAAGNGAVVTQRENELFLLDGFVGAYASLPLEGGWRVYGGTGPVMQYAGVDTEDLDQPLGTEADSLDGFGGGWYARAGVELEFDGPLLIGLGVRWVDSFADLGPDLNDLFLDGVQFGLKLSQAY